MFEVADGRGAQRADVEVKITGRRGRESRWIRTGSAGEVLRVLKAARDQSGLSNREIAKELGISYASVCALRQGQKQPSLLLVVRWLGVCGWDLLAVER